MSDGFQRRIIELKEQQLSDPKLLWEGDAALLKELDFEVICLATSGTACANTGQACFQVNPKQYVSHLALPSGDVVLVKPKVDPANVFRMLAYVYVGWNKDVFRKAEVLYSTDRSLFEPLVELFGDLVAARVRRGLVQDYVRHEENLSVMRGRVLFERQVVTNAGRPDRLFCRYHQQTPDTEDNQIVKWTLRYLTGVEGWSTQTVHSLRVNLRHFSEVSLRGPEPGALCGRVYHRMNDDYRLLHDLCRLFLENGAITEHADDWRFRGFRLDMNLLFEAFVARAFSTVARFTCFTAHSQKTDLLSQPPSTPLWIRPDVTVSEGSRTAAIVDAKYKRLDDGPLGNSDFYQMLAYGTVLQCSRAYLFYPLTEWSDDRMIEVRHSPIKIHVRRIDIGHQDCVSIVEQAAKTVLDEASVKPAPEP